MQQNDKNTIAVKDILYNSRTVDGVTEVYPQKGFGIIAIVCLIGFIILAITQIPNQTSSVLFEIVVLCFFGALCMPLILFSFVLRYYVDSKRIIYRTMLGIKKEMRWNDIKTVRILPSKTVKLYDSHRVIKVYTPRYFGRGYEYMRIAIRKYCTDAEWK